MSLARILMFSVYLTVQASLLCMFLWVLWRALKQIVVRHPLDNIPGPPPQSYLWGTFCFRPSDGYLVFIRGLISAGNFKQIFNPQSWAFHQSLVDQYGGVVKIYGAFSVRKLQRNITDRWVRDYRTFNFMFLTPNLYIISSWRTNMSSKRQTGSFSVFLSIFMHLNLSYSWHSCRSNRMMFGMGLFGTLGRSSASWVLYQSLIILWH